jgi:hypothetical protein
MHRNRLMVQNSSHSSLYCLPVSGVIHFLSGYFSGWNIASDINTTIFPPGFSKCSKAFLVKTPNLIELEDNANTSPEGTAAARENHAPLK